MKPSRLFYTSMMTFWIVFLSMLALVYTYTAQGTAQGGVQIAGLVLFANTSLMDPALAAMGAIGFSETTQSILIGLLGGLNLGAAGLVLFSMLFCVFGQEAEQRDSRPLAEGAAACGAAAAAGIVMISFAGGEVGILVFLQVFGLGGLALTAMAVGRADTVDVSGHDTAAIGIGDVITDHAAAHAAFSAQIASLSRREMQS